MLTILKKSSKFKISMFIILELNFIYLIGYTGNILIEEHYSFIPDISIFISLIHILFVPFIGYVLHYVFSKKLVWDKDRAYINKRKISKIINEKELNNASSLKNKIDKYDEDFNTSIKVMNEYETISTIIKFNYFIIFTFSLIVTICNYTQVNIEIYTIFQTLFSVLSSLTMYYFNIRENKKIGIILKNLSEIKNLPTKVRKIPNRNENIANLDKTCFIGIGGGGTNIIEDISKIDNKHIFIHINSDCFALHQKTSKHKLLLGWEKNAGLGCGGNDACGQSLINNDIKDALYQLTKEMKQINIISTLGGGVGSGSTPEIVEYLQSLNKDIMVFVTLPFSFEGHVRSTVANKALEKLKQNTSRLIILQNDDLINTNQDASFGMKDSLKIISNSIYKKLSNELITTIVMLYIF